MKDLQHNFESEVFVPAEPTHLAKDREYKDVTYKTDTHQDTIPEILDRVSRLGNEGQAFFAVDLGEPIRRVRRWRELLPRVEPFYAVKCNPNQALLKTLAQQGIGFDCASREEISTVLKLGVSSERIIFANPCKPIQHIRYAKQNEVTMMTFDNADELRKIKEHYPEAKLVLRVLTDDSRSVCRFGVKFGAKLSTARKLVRLARELDLDLIGVSFHVGSGCFDPTAYSDAVYAARQAFDLIEAAGYEPHLLDLGGGYPGLDGVDGAPFPEIAACLRAALEQYFPAHQGVRVIAEPGRYMAAACFTLAVSVVSRRVIQDDEEEDPSFMYYVSDGVYGSFNCIMFDHAKVTPKVLRKGGNFVFGCPVDEPCYESSLWGPTCDSIDRFCDKSLLPELQLGDWLVFNNMGAYTAAAASTFNGFPLSSLFYTNTEA